MSEGFVIEGRENVEMARLLALRSGISLELKTGMKMGRRSASQIATEYLKGIGLVAEGKRPNKNTVYRLLNGVIVDALGEGFDRPL